MAILCPCLTAQNADFGFASNPNRVEIPFVMKNDLMLVDVEFNHFFSLKFIFDTGAQNTILSKKEISDLMGIPYEREFTVMGADMSTELKAYLIRNIHFGLGGRAAIPRHSLLVLDEDYFRFEEMAGLEIHGILGADIFRGMVVKINYERQRITLLRKSKFNPPGDFFQTPIEVSRGKAYLKTEVSIMEGSPRPVKLLLDSGAMLFLLVNTNDDEGLSLPPHVLTGQLGAGLGGFIEGYLGRVSKVDFGEIECRDVLTNFQELSEDADTTLLNGRSGIIGNKLLQRFHLIIDYSDGVLYYKPNKRFKTGYEFDKSGLIIVAAGAALNKFYVHELFEGSPAELAGVKKEDQIIRINGIPTSMMNLSGISRKLRKKEGRKIKMVVRRNGEKVKFTFRLKKLI